MKITSLHVSSKPLMSVMTALSLVSHTSIASMAILRTRAPESPICCARARCFFGSRCEAMVRNTRLSMPRTISRNVRVTRLTQPSRVNIHAYHVDQSTLASHAVIVARVEEVASG